MQLTYKKYFDSRDGAAQNILMGMTMIWNAEIYK